MRLTLLPPLSLYIHWPWCRRKCPYCDFNSHTLSGAEDEATYLAALLADLDAVRDLITGRRIESIFIGGGTPSLMQVGTLATLLEAIAGRFSLADDVEITLEANPGASETARFAGYRSAGVDRLSLGVQSFSAAQLVALGRIHDGAQALAALAAALTHFPRVNVDLMFVLPGQTLASLERDLAIVCAAAPGQISAYQLTIEPHTAFHASPPPLPDEELAAAMHALIDERTSTAGYAHYEISAYARPGEACRHNLNYWTFGDYLGIGAGAHSKLTLPDGRCREARPRSPRAYLAQPTRRNWQPVAEEDVPGEFMMNALRLTEGVPADLYEMRTGLSLAGIARALAAARQAGLLGEDASRLQPTPLGLRFLNRLIGYFL